MISQVVADMQIDRGRKLRPGNPACNKRTDLRVARLFWGELAVDSSGIPRESGLPDDVAGRLPPEPLLVLLVVVSGPGRCEIR